MQLLYYYCIHIHTQLRNLYGYKPRHYIVIIRYKILYSYNTMTL